MARLIHTTIADYLREEEVNVLRNRILLNYLESKGRVIFNESGLFMDWKLRFRRAPLQGYADGDTLTFSRQNRHKTAQLDWRGYTVQDSFGVMEELMNRGDAAIIKFASDKGGMLVDDITEGFGDEFYIDGNATGNTKRIHGMESFLGYSGPAAAGYIASPSDSYAGLNTDLGSYGGAWSVNGSSQVEWPNGTGDYHYDFFSPLIVDYTDTAWAASTKTWPNTCREALRYGIIKSRKNKSRRSMLDLILLENEMFRQFKDKVEANERINVTRGNSQASSSGSKQAIGFPDMFNYDGVDIGFEYGLPTNFGYGFPTSDMALMCLQDRLFVVRGPDMDISGLANRVVVTFFGNLKFASPRNTVAWKNVT
jgi:hypothetical protein